MKARRLQFALWAGFALLSVSLIFGVASEHREAKADMFRSVRNYARLMAEHANGIFRAAELSTRGIVQSPAVRTCLEQASDDFACPDRSTVEMVLKDFQSAVPGLINTFITDAQGRVLAGALGVPDGTKISDREYFRELAAAQGSAVAISETIKGRASGKWSIQIARRVETARGKFIGIVGVSLGIEELFSTYYASLQWPSGTAITLWSLEQRLLMRYPMLEDQVGKRSTGNLLKHMNEPAAREAVDVGPSEFDGQIRARAMYKVDAYPVVAIVAAPSEGYFAAWRASAIRVAIAEAVLLLGVIVLGRLLGRRHETAEMLSRERERHHAELEGYARIVQSAPVAQVLLDQNLNCLIANPAFGFLVGRDHRELLGQPITEFFSTAGWDDLMRDVEAGLGGRMGKREVCLPQGEVQRIFSGKVLPLNDSGASGGIVLSLRDITIQKMAEDALAEREAEFKAIFDAEPECVKIFDLEGRLRKINRAGLEIIEADNLEHGLATRIEDLIVPEDRAAYRAYCQRVLAGEDEVIQYRGVGLKGTMRYVETHATPMRDTQGKIVGILAISRDISRQKETESLLQATLSEQQAMLDNGIVGIIKIRDRRVVWTNAACEQLLGYAPEALVDQPTQNFYADLADYHEVGAAYSELETGETWHGKVPLLHRDGSIRWFLLSGGQQHGNESLWALVDITAQHAAEVHLRQLSLAVEQSPDAIMITDTDRHIQYVNKAFTQITGYEAAEALGRDPSFLQSGNTPTETYRSLWGKLQGGAVWSGEFQNQRKSGEEYVAHGIVAPVRQGNGEITNYLAIERDVTEQKRLSEEVISYQKHLEQMVRERTAELDDLYNQAPCGYFSFDCEGKVVAINDTALTLLGYLRPDVIGRLRVVDFLASHDVERYLASFGGSVERGALHDHDYDFLRQDGSVFPVVISLEIVVGGDGRLTSGRATFSDNRERQARERQIAVLNTELENTAHEAVEASRAKSRFLANMSHEIRTPLNAIIGMAHLMQKGTLTEKQLDQLGKIGAAGEHLLEVISNILDLSKIESGKLTLERVDILPNELLPCVASLIEQRAVEKGLKLVTESQSIGVGLAGDLTRLRQALLNLATNAVKFTESGAITLRMKLIDELAGRLLIRFEVEDTGPGIPPEKMATLFTAFQQADSSTTRKYGGTGLGLVITRQIAQLMGGDAGVSSRVGQGSLFWMSVWLDRSGEETRVLKLRDNQLHDLTPVDLSGLEGCRLLLVEDEPINQEIGRAILEDSGFIVDIACDGAEAIRLAVAGKYALILMDMQMPVLDGVAATRHLRDDLSLDATPIIAMTANAFAEDRSRCLEVGMNDFLSKPINPEILISTVVRWLRQKSAPNRA